MSKAINKFNDSTIELLKSLGVNGQLIHFASTNIERNDVAHHFDHVESVITNAVLNMTLINKESFDYKNNSKIRIVAIAALLHDTACWCDRANHHIVAAEWVMDTLDSKELLEFYGLVPEEVSSIAIAIREHRASWKHKRSTIESEVVAAADRGELTYEESLRRSYLYGRYAKKLSVQDATIHACDKIAEKYGPEGYAYENLPALCLIRGEEIKLLKQNSLDKELGYSIIRANLEQWESHYDEVLNVSKKSRGS